MKTKYILKVPWGIVIRNGMMKQNLSTSYGYSLWLFLISLLEIFVITKSTQVKSIFHRISSWRKTLRKHPVASHGRVLLWCIESRIHFIFMVFQSFWGEMVWVLLVHHSGVLPGWGFWLIRLKFYSTWQSTFTIFQ